jgi:DNA-binding NtrC family response regulator
VEDISLLASHFLKKHATAGRGPLTLTPEAQRALFSYTWPGNVRELENAILRGIHLSEGREDVDVGDLGLPLPAGAPRETSREDTPVRPSYKSLKRQAIELFERSYLIQLMSQFRGNVSRAARAAGKERRDLGKLLKKYQIDPQIFRLCL